MAVLLVGFLTWREVTRDLPPVEQLLNYHPPVATRVFADDNTLIGEFFLERRYLIPIDRIPEVVKQAFMAAEDADFYKHRGVNPTSIVRAFVTNMSRQEVAQGGSTITQQVVKQLLLSPERSFERKAKEMILAIQLENKLSKEDILYLYLNQIYFGAGTHGIAAAARTFFDLDVSELSIAQAALLAGLPQAPSRYDPSRHPQSAIARQHYVLERMKTEHFITPEQYEAALTEPLAFSGRKPITYNAAPWYVEHVRRLLEERYGDAFAQLGLRVYTAVDLTMQKKGEQSLRDGLRRVEKAQGFRGAIRHLEDKKIDAYLTRSAIDRSPTDPQHAVVMKVGSKGLVVRSPWETGVVEMSGLAFGDRTLPPSNFHPGDVISVEPGERGSDHVLRFALDQDPQVEGALVAIDPYSGYVKTLVGGVDFRRSQFNRATQAHRQPGSAFKPLIYAAAIDHGYTPASPVLDAPISLRVGGKLWSPKNSSAKYYGRIQLRTALTYSLNTVSVRLVDDMGVQYVRDYLTMFDFPTMFPRNYSIALGASEVTPLDLTRAFGVFTTLGKRFDPIFITGVTDSTGNPLEFAGTRPHFVPVMNPATAYVMTNMLQSVVKKGTGTAALALGRPAAGKTGTTNENKDAWFVGFTPDLVTGVWVGYDAKKSLGSYFTGGHAATPIWTSFMKGALADRPVLDFPIPSGVTLMAVDSSSGMRAVSGRSSRMEVFVQGTEPTRFAPKRRAVSRSNDGGGGGGGNEDDVEPSAHEEEPSNDD